MAYPIEGASYKPKRSFVENMKAKENESSRPFSQKSPDPAVDFVTLPAKENGGFGIMVIQKIR